MDISTLGQVIGHCSIIIRESLFEVSCNLNPPEGTNETKIKIGLGGVNHHSGTLA